LEGKVQQKELDCNAESWSSDTQHREWRIMDHGKGEIAQAAARAGMMISSNAQMGQLRELHPVIKSLPFEFPPSPDAVLCFDNPPQQHGRPSDEGEPRGGK
jgi:hypothetical protein